MAHETTSMVRVKHPTESFGQAVRGVDDTRDVDHGNATLFFPILDGKKSNVNVSGAFSRSVGIDDLDGGFIVFVKGSRLRLSKSKLI